MRRHSILFALFVLFAVSSYGQSTAFNYQGSLTDGGLPVNGSYQMRFKLFDAVSGGAQVGSTLDNVVVTLTNGTFTTTLDFGANPFPGANRFLEVAVRRNASESYVVLTPREQITSSPYALRTLSSAMADDAQKLGGVAASEYVTTASVGTQFIRNQSTLQPTSNFNISGNGQLAGQLGVGIGFDPFYRGQFGGPVRSLSPDSTHFVAHTQSAFDNAWARFYMRTNNRSWFIGTSKNFNGDQFYLVDETAGQTRMAISSSGLFGINQTNPQAGLHIAGTGSQVQQRITDNTSGNSLVLQAGADNNMKVTGYNYGSNTAVPLYLSVDGADTIMSSGGGNVGIGTTTPTAKLTVVGNINQNIASAGAVKAMLHVQGAGTPYGIIRCYNGQTGATTGDCGFEVNRESTGVYVIDFNFDVSTRYLSLTTWSSGFGLVKGIAGPRVTDPQTVWVRLFGLNDAPVSAEFYLLVF